MKPRRAETAGGGEAPRLAHDGRERRPLERRRLLVDDPDQAVPADLERDGIEAHAGTSTTSARPASTRQRAPGPRTAVDSRSSTIAGPLKALPGSSA